MGQGTSFLRTIVSESALLVAIRVAGMSLGLLLMVLLARGLPAADFGQVTLAISIALLGGLLITLNVGAGAMRFLTGYVTHELTGLGGAYVRFGRRIVLYFALAIWSLIGAVLAGAWLGWWSAVPSHLLVGLAAMPAFAWMRVDGANVAALDAVVLAAIPKILLRQVLMCVAVLGLMYLAGGLARGPVLAAFLVTAFGVVLAQWLLYRGQLSPLLAGAGDVPEQERRDWVKMGLSLLIPTLFLELSVDTIIVLASVVLDNSQIAVLGVVLRLQAIILFGVTSINMVIGPKIARAHRQQDRATVDHLVRIAAHLKLWPSLLCLVALWLLGEWILGLFGAAYTPHLATLLILALNSVVMAIFGPVVLFVTVLGLQRRANHVFQSAVALLALSIFVLGHFLGTVGVALSAVAVWVYWHLRLYLIIRREAGYDTLQPRGLSI